MTRFIVMLIATATLISGEMRAADVSVSATGGQAEIHFAEPSFDCGKIMANKVIRHEFRFENRGKATLNLTNVAPSCGCTVAGDWTRTVEPGKEGVVPVTFTVPAMEGVFAKAISVYSNDAASPVLQLQIRGTAWQAFEIAPATLVFGGVEGEPIREAAKAKITCKLENPVTLSDAVCGIAGTKVDLKELEKGRSYELTLTPGFDKAVQGNSQVTLRTTAKDLPTLMVPVVVSLVPALAISPARLPVPDEPLAEPRTLRVMVRNNLAEPLKVDTKATAPAGAKVAVKETEQGKCVVLEVELPAGWKPAWGESPALVFRTNMAGRERVEIPFAPERQMVGGGPPDAPPQAPAASPELAALRARVKFAATTHDAGAVKAGTTVTHKFGFDLAAGGAPLEVLRVDACSNKGLVRDWTRRVEAGKFGSVSVELDTAGLEGPVEVAYLVMAKGISEPLAELRIKATVNKPAPKS